MQPIAIIFYTARDLADIIKVQNFISIGAGVSDLARVKFGASHRKPQRPLPLCVALSCTHVIGGSLSLVPSNLLYFGLLTPNSA